MLLFLRYKCEWLQKTYYVCGKNQMDVVTMVHIEFFLRVEKGHLSLNLTHE